MPTAQELFIRWQELNKMTDELDTDTAAFKDAYQEQCNIENDLKDGFHLLLAWDNDAKEWYLIDTRA